MPRATLTLEDLPDGTLRLTVDSEPPFTTGKASDAQAYIMALMQWAQESGAKISQCEEPVILSGYDGETPIAG